MKEETIEKLTAPCDCCGTPVDVCWGTGGALLCTVCSSPEGAVSNLVRAFRLSRVSTDILSRRLREATYDHHIAVNALKACISDPGCAAFARDDAAMLRCRLATINETAAEALKLLQPDTPYDEGKGV